VSPAYQGWATIGAAGDVDGKTLVMCYAGEGCGWVAPKVASLISDHDIVEVSITPGAARGLEPDLAREGVEYRKLTGVEVAASCAAFQANVRSGSVMHVGQAVLDTAVSNAKTRRSGDAETWDRGYSELVACAAASYRWGLLADRGYDLLDSVAF
jgi:hypothetical protein